MFFLIYKHTCVQDSIKTFYLLYTLMIDLSAINDKIINHWWIDILFLAPSELYKCWCRLVSLSGVIMHFISLWAYKIDGLIYLMVLINYWWLIYQLLMDWSINGWIDLSINGLIKNWNKKYFFQFFFKFFNFLIFVKKINFFKFKKKSSLEVEL